MGWQAVRYRSRCSRRGQATCSATVEAGAARGAAVGAARGRNPGGTAGAGRGATSGSNPGGTSGAGWQGVTVPAVVSRVPMVETMETDSQRKSRSVGLDEAKGRREEILPTDGVVW
jgi:hypothetical protein